MIFQFLDLDLPLPDFEGLPFDWSVLEWDGCDEEEGAGLDGPSKSLDSSVIIFSKSSIFFSLDSNNVLISSSLSFHLWRFFLHWCIFRTRTTSFLWASDKSLHLIEVFDFELLLFGDDISRRETRSEYRWCKRFHRWKSGRKTQKMKILMCLLLSVIRLAWIRKRYQVSWSVPFIEIVIIKFLKL